MVVANRYLNSPRNSPRNKPIWELDVGFQMVYNGSAHGHGTGRCHFSQSRSQVHTNLNGEPMPNSDIEFRTFSETFGMPEIIVEKESSPTKHIDTVGRRLLIQKFLKQFAESPKEVAPVWYRENSFIDANAFYQSLKNEADRLYPDKIFVFYNVRYSRSTVYLYKEGEFAREMMRRYSLNNEKFNDSNTKPKKEIEYRQGIPFAKTGVPSPTGAYERTAKIAKRMEARRKITAALARKHS